MNEKEVRTAVEIIESEVITESHELEDADVISRMLLEDIEVMMVAVKQKLNAYLLYSETDECKKFYQ